MKKIDITKLTEVPRESGHIILAYGEVTGHAHRIPHRSAKLYRDESDARFLRATAPVTLRHEEHAPIKLPTGDYRVVIQKEYVPGELPRNVAD